MRNCEKQVFETWRGKQDEVYQVKNNLFCGLVLFTESFLYLVVRRFQLKFCLYKLLIPTLLISCLFCKQKFLQCFTPQYEKLRNTLRCK